MDHNFTSAPSRRRQPSPYLRWEDLPLFASDGQIGEALLGKERAGEFKHLAPMLERRGFPKIDARLGGRYTPAVRRHFDCEYGLAKDGPEPPDGVEDPSVWKKRR